MYPEFLRPVPQARRPGLKFFCEVILSYRLEKLNSILSSVLKQHPSAGSFYVISRPRVQRQLFTWKSLMPEIKPYYAVKCNPEPQLIKWLAPEAGFDCASAREIQIVKELAPKSDIVFANPCKKEDDIYYAMKQGVKTTVVDSYEEIDKLYHCR